MTITTDPTPSRFGMPTWAAFPIATDAAAGYAGAHLVGIVGIERDRVSVKGHLGLAQAFVPGPSAWSPPS